MADEKDKSADAADKQEEKGSKKEKTPFSDDQKDFINNIVNDVFGRGYKKASEQFESTLTPKLEQLFGEITSLKTELAEVKTPKNKKTEDEKQAPAATTPEAQELLTKLASQEELIGRFQQQFKDMEDNISRAKQQEKEQRLRDIVMREAKERNFFDPEDTFALLKDELKYDDNGNVLVWSSSSNAPKLGFDGSKMTLGERLDEFAKKKPHLVRAEGVQPGSGSSESDRTKFKDEAKADTPDFTKMSDAEFDEYSNRIQNQRFN